MLRLLLVGLLIELQLLLSLLAAAWESLGRAEENSTASPRVLASRCFPGPASYMLQLHSLLGQMKRQSSSPGTHRLAVSG